MNKIIPLTRENSRESGYKWFDEMWNHAKFDNAFIDGIKGDRWYLHVPIVGGEWDETVQRVYYHRNTGTKYRGRIIERIHLVLILKQWNWVLCFKGDNVDKAIRIDEKKRLWEKILEK